MPKQQLDLVTALGHGDPEAVAALIAAGEDIRYKREHGYDALLDAVHGRDVARDSRLLDLLGLLVANSVDLNGISAHKESGLRVLSHIGRFDAVRAGPSEIRVSGGKLVTANGAEEAHTDNPNAFVLDVKRLLWRGER